MPISYLDIDFPSLEMPPRKWSHGWPLNIHECIVALNNGRANRDQRNYANRLNLTGDQKLALKLVNDCFLPSNNKDSKMTNIQTFLTHAIMSREKINLPSLILRHMEYSKDKKILPYGMILSYILLSKGVDVSEYESMGVPPNSRIGRLSLKSQEIYIWEDKLWAKWEVYEYFETDLSAIWRHNQTVEPAAPKGWVPRGHNNPPPNHESRLRLEGDFGQTSGGQPTHERMSDRDLLESIQAEQQRQGMELQRLGAMQQTFANDYGEYQWRQTALLRAMSGQMGLATTFDSLFGGFPTTAPAPPADPMDRDDHDHDA